MLVEVVSSIVQRVIDFDCFVCHFLAIADNGYFADIISYGGGVLFSLIILAVEIF